MKSTTYKDIFTSNFLDYFKDHKKEIAQLKIKDNDFSIDVDKIIECLGLEEIDTVIFDKAGQYNSNKHMIVVNILDNLQRQRFTKAHEIGHAVLGHVGENGISNRNVMSYGYDVNEIEANKFAAELLMPKKLILELIKKYQFDKNIKRVEDINVDNLIKYLAKQLNVSMMSMKYRLLNLKLIIVGDSSE